MPIHFSAKMNKCPQEKSLADIALQAYANNPAGSKWNIFQAYLKGDFAGEEAKILPIIEAEAEDGSFAAQSVLGESFLYGLGKPKDIDKAIFWLEKAAEQRDGRAQYLLGTLCEKEKPEKALPLYIEAFHAGIKESEYPLGRYCELGMCMPKLPYLAAYWYRRASRNGDERAKDAFERVISQLGEDKWQNCIKKIFKFGAFPDTIMLAEAGDAKKQYELGKIYMDGVFTAKNPELALEWLKKSVFQGYFKAFYQIGLAYYDGIGLEKDVRMAADYFRKGAEAGHNEAAYALGYLYQEGEGVEKNIDSAKYWYQQAIDASRPPNEIDDVGDLKASETLEKLNDKQSVKLDLVSVEHILNEELEIPEYQRIYSWSVKEIRQLWETIKDTEPDFETHMGSLIIYDSGKYQEIVDGQQRLITLSLMLVALVRQKDGEIQDSDIPKLLKRSVRNNDEKINIANARWIIENILSTGVDREAIKNKILKLRFTKILIPQDDPDLAYIFFNNQNSKGEKLTDFDLLKAHHLRFIGREKEAIHLADKWNRINRGTEKTPMGNNLLRQSLGVLVYRLRQLVSKKIFNENGFYIRDEFQSASLPEDMYAFIREITFDSPIQGGAHFFNFAEYFYEKYREFAETAEAKKLASLSKRHKYLYAICECFLFAYFLKFAKSYMTEALFCICAIVGQYRYGRSTITWKIAQEAAFDSNLIYFISHAPSPAFFIGEALSAMDKISPMLDPDKLYTPQLIKNPPSGKKLSDTSIKKNFYDLICHICTELEENFTVLPVIEKIKKDYA